MGQKPTPYEVFTKTHGVFDAESGNCSQWTNTKAEKVHVILLHTFNLLHFF